MSDSAQSTTKTPAAPAAAAEAPAKAPVKAPAAEPATPIPGAEDKVKYKKGKRIVSNGKAFIQATFFIFYFVFGIRNRLTPE